jgi:hypothetical protein
MDVKILAMMLVKDERDVVPACIERARSWADRIIVLDNGSSDGTWEYITENADEQLIAWKQTTENFRRSFRADMFNAFRHLASPGDWWAKVDADEFFYEDPRKFLAGVPWWADVVHKRTIDFVLTEEDVEEHEFSGEFTADREKIRYYRVNKKTARRFFRHRKNLKWPGSEQAPVNAGVSAPEPITVLHYQLRSPEQIQRRLDVRNAIVKDDEGGPFRHVQQTEWRELIGSRAELSFWDGSLDLSQVQPKRRIKSSLKKALKSYVQARLG